MLCPLNPIFWRGCVHSIDLNGQFHPYSPMSPIPRSSFQYYYYYYYHANLVTWSSFRLFADQLDLTKTKNVRTVFCAAICRWHFQNTGWSARNFSRWWKKRGAWAVNCVLEVFQFVADEPLARKIVLTTFSEQSQLT